jgi:hypothetical protein
MSLHLHSSTRRPEPLKNTDYDHEINLVDHTRQDTALIRDGGPSSRSRSAGRITQASDAASDSSSRRLSDVPLKKRHTKDKLRKEMSKRKYKKFQDRGNTEADDVPRPQEDTAEEEDDQVEQTPESSPARNGEDAANEETPDRGRRKRRNKSPETAIDVLYENQRGLFLCGMALFSSKALGNLDPSPWTNIAHKTSATDITNAQVPDPSWEWVSKEWTVNYENDVDEDGWEYSFAFSNKFSWHGRSWYNSYVRRRAWVRKRAKKQLGYQAQPLAHRLNSDYFIIHPAAERADSKSRASITTDAIRYSVDKLAKRDMEEIVTKDICDINALMVALRLATIDREKLEAVENYIVNSGDDLFHIKECMHEIMKMFIFQASRKILVSHLHKAYNELAEQVEEHADDDDNTQLTPKRRLEHLSAALGHADEEVRKLEYWSDVKEMAENGETIHGVDKTHGWQEKEWEGVDASGPRDVISKPHLAGNVKERQEKGMGRDKSSSKKADETSIKTDSKTTKGKEKE